MYLPIAVSGIRTNFAGNAFPTEPASDSKPDRRAGGGGSKQMPAKWPGKRLADIALRHCVSSLLHRFNLFLSFAYIFGRAVC